MSPKYQVLARKYRPRILSELIGQNVLVQTLTNAIEQNRIPHAFMLTGIRGVGKTSSARIIAKCLNNTDGMSATPAEDCDQCRSIEESRHPDVLEMDAASRTGVGDIREIIDSVQYAPTIGRYKVYIIDEVHMLSKNAFNALLKTLEEPPEHCIFIFATTEIRKVPVTILSRCMRFDLPRVNSDILSQHLTNIAQKESVSLEDQAAKLLAHIAEGSVRDALSLLDQAIGNVGNGESVTFSAVQKMLGLTDRTQLFDLLQAIIDGSPVNALAHLDTMYKAGADPIMLLQDLLDMTHILTVGSVHKGELPYEHMSDSDQSAYQKLITQVGVPFLSRLWQMLLKGLDEARKAPSPLTAAEMILIRITYASDMPTPNDLIKKLKDGDNAPSNAAPAALMQQPTAPITANSNDKPLDADPADFNAMISLFSSHQENVIAAHMKEVAIVSFNAAERRFDFSPASHTPANLASQLNHLLNSWTGNRWMVSISAEQGSDSVNHQIDAADEQSRQDAINDKLVKDALSLFPNSHIVATKKIME